MPVVFTVEELDALDVSEIVAFADSKPEIQDFQRTRYLAPLVEHLGQRRGVDMSEVLLRPDFEIYAATRAANLTPTDGGLILTMQEARSLSTLALMNYKGKATILDFPRQRYVDAYEGFLEGLDPDVAATYPEASERDDLGLYADVLLNDVSLGEENDAAFHVVTSVTVDEDLARRTVELLVAYDAEWEEAEYTETEQVEELVELAIQALGLQDEEAAFSALYEDGKVEGLVIEGQEALKGTPAGVCIAIVHAQYANGKDYDLNLLTEATEEAKALPKAPAPTLP
jgi:hypothetical protein